MPSTLIPVSEYLATTYRPDCDYVDGELVERNLGEREHAALQGILNAIFHSKRRRSDPLSDSGHLRASRV